MSRFWEVKYHMYEKVYEVAGISNRARKRFSLVMFFSGNGRGPV